MFKYYDVNVIRLGNEYKCVYLKRAVREDGLYFGKDDFKDDKIGDRWLLSVFSYQFSRLMVT